jgi:uridine phosphorylase
VRPRAPRTLPLARNDYREPSQFVPENLLREGRRQRGLPDVPVPEACLLDPDGDIVRHLRRNGAREHRGWACYHTEMLVTRIDDGEIGVVGCAVGAPFAVLVAEEMFASGCRFLVSVTSSGQIAPSRPPPYFILIDRALRDEGTSHHYLAPSRWSEVAPALVATIHGGLRTSDLHVDRGATWTTDAPFRETASAIARARRLGASAVEMEAAGLYAFAQARGRDVVCFAHVTNQMGRVDADFEKGEADGAVEALRLVGATVRAWRGR